MTQNGDKRKDDRRCIDDLRVIRLPLVSLVTQGSPCAVALDTVLALKAPL
jgi:hypothetical protein